MIVGSPWPSPPPESAVDDQRSPGWNRSPLPNSTWSNANATAGSVPGSKHAAILPWLPRSGIVSSASFHSGRIAS